VQRRALLGTPSDDYGLAARLIAPHLVTPNRMEAKGGKNDATDAAAFCDAAPRPQMRFVPIKTAVQQGLMALHVIREGFKDERTAWTNRLRGRLAEFELVFGKSLKVLRAALPKVLEDTSNKLSGSA
jgi:transposase